jgi:hypothetical protein
MLKQQFVFIRGVLNRGIAEDHQQPARNMTFNTHFHTSSSSLLPPVSL